LKLCQDEKKIAGEALEQSKKELEKLQKTHEDDLSLIENLRKTMTDLRKLSRIFVLTRPTWPDP
jgi:hypothetical protein